MTQSLSHQLMDACFFTTPPDLLPDANVTPEEVWARAGNEFPTEMESTQYQKDLVWSYDPFSKIINVIIIIIINMITIKGFAGPTG
jgi:hypothetical protein